MDFREWAKDNCFQSKDAYVGAEQAWDYLQQKIDEVHIANLNLMRNKQSMVEHNDKMFKQAIKQDNCIRDLRSEIDGLQKRIGKAVDKLHDIFQYEYDTKTMKKIVEIKEILK